AQHLVWGPQANNPDVAQTAPFNCPMGVAVENSGNILVTVFSYFSYGCSIPGIFRVDLMSHSQVTISSNPPVGWQLPFGITTEEDSSILVADVTIRWIFRLRPIPLDPNNPLANFGTPLPLSPPNGDANQNAFANPVGLIVVKFQPTVNISQPPTVSINGAPLTSPEGTAINLSS